MAMVVFGIGAGLRPGELVALRGGDVARYGRQVTVRITGPAARAVPVASRYAGRAAELAAALAGVRVPPGPADRSYKNFVTSFARSLTADPARTGAVDAPGPVQLHLRSPGCGHPGRGAAVYHRDRRGGSLARRALGGADAAGVRASDPASAIPVIDSSTATGVPAAR